MMGILGLERGVFIARILHLANISYSIGAFDNHINLAGWFTWFVAPGVILGEHSVKAERLNNLPYMEHTDALESKSVPSVLPGSVQRMAPESAVRNGGVAECEIEDGEEIHQSVKAGILFPADAIVTDKIAVQKILEEIGKFFSRTDFQRFSYFFK